MVEEEEMEGKEIKRMRKWREVKSIEKCSVSLHFDTQSLFTPHLTHSYRSSSADASVDYLMDV